MTPSFSPCSWRAFALWPLLTALTACGADVEPYRPSLGGIVNEGIDPNAPPQDVSYADNSNIERVDDSVCTAPSNYFAFTINVDNQYRKRTVKVRHIDPGCVEREGDSVAPGEVKTVGVYQGEVVRILDASDGAVLSSWRVNKLNALGVDRIVLRSTSPDI